jgi:inositol-polyphosphate multikinase
MSLDATQVGGHDGITTSEDESLLIKPALPMELKFYELLNADISLEPLRPFVPKFYGSLKLSEPEEEGEGTLNTAASGAKGARDKLPSL